MVRMPILLYNTPAGPLLRIDQDWFSVAPQSWDELLNAGDLQQHLLAQAVPGRRSGAPAALLAPVGSQEIWAAGVTYYRSRDARIEESKPHGGADFYDRVYAAQRPELFLKATPHRCVADGEAMHLRRDSNWIVPEPELTLVVNARAEIVGYTVGNDLSCRDIEGENPLYLPQAKIFDRCASVGPCVRISSEPLPPDTGISCWIIRGDTTPFHGHTTLGHMKQTPRNLVDYLFRDNRFPAGCLLMTGTGIVPPADFRLQRGDLVRITIDGIGTLSNVMR